MLSTNFRRNPRRSLVFTLTVMGLLAAVAAFGHEVHDELPGTDNAAGTDIARMSPGENLRAFRRNGDDRHLDAAWFELEPLVQKPDADSKTLLLAAEVAQARHQFDAASSLAERVLDSDPNDDGAWLLTASIALVGGDIERAREACRSLKRLPVVALLTCRARVQTAAGNPQRALGELEPLLAREHALTAENRWTAWLYSAAGDAAAAAGDPRAVRFLERSLEIEDSAQVRAALIDRLLESGRDDDVLEVLDGPSQSLALEIRRWIVAGRLGRLERHSHAVEHADEEFRSWIARGDFLHAREMARFYLDVLPDLELAARLAEINLRSQREPEDLALLRRTARIDSGMNTDKTPRSASPVKTGASPKMTEPRGTKGVLGCCTLLAMNAAIASDSDSSIDEIVTYGRADQLVGVVRSASAGTVGYDDLRLPPFLRPGALAEAVPGMVATQHSGSGKANQYFLRGFNLDHGTDFSASLDGVPLNMRTHGHGQGYLDINFIIPELVATANYRKGPYYADVGDFSSAGAVEFQLYDRLDESLARLSVGEFGYLRALAAGSAAIGEGTLTAALDASAYDGPWSLSEDLDQRRGYASYRFPFAGGEARVSLQGFSNEWRSTDQVPRRAVASGLIGRYDPIDPDLGGKTSRNAATFAADFDQWAFDAYIVDYDFTLYSNFTYLLEDPVNGDEFEQRDERQVFGGSARGQVDLSNGDSAPTLHWGTELRLDDIAGVGLYPTASRQRLGTVREDVVDERSLGAWSEVRWNLSDTVRATAGLRVDYFEWTVRALEPGNSGSGDDAQVSPKLSVAWQPVDAIDLYLNYGRGMHSNDVRGVTTRTDPVSGEPADPAPALVASDGGEVGFRYAADSRFNATVAVFYLQLDSELVFVGDAGGTEANDASERLGLELNTFWQANDWLALDASYTRTRARFDSDPGAGRQIPGANEETATLGLNAAWQNGLASSLRFRYLGEAPLIEDNSVRAPSSLLVNAGIAYRHESTEWRLDVFNLLDSDDYDIAYYYPSRLEGEPADGIEDVHFHPFEPRSLRASVTVHF